MGVRKAINKRGNNSGEHHIFLTKSNKFLVQVSHKYNSYTKTFSLLEDAKAYRDDVISKLEEYRRVPQPLPPLSPEIIAEMRTAYQAEYYKTVSKPKRQAGIPGVAAPEDARRTKGDWSGKPVQIGGPSIVSWT
jgi:hypothetical protein